MQMFSGNGDSVLDFCAGFGGRLLAALSLDRKYIGVEPSRKTLRGLERMSRRLSSLSLSRGSARLLEGRAEKILPRLPSSSVTLVLTSPPYFDREQYGRDGRRDFPQYVSYELWRDNFLRVTLEESARLLKRGGSLVLNVADTSEHHIVHDTRRLAARHFSLRQVYRMRIPVRSFQRRQLGRLYRHEPVMVFERKR
jgi:DNA modification methylase